MDHASADVEHQHRNDAADGAAPFARPRDSRAEATAAGSSGRTIATLTNLSQIEVAGWSPGRPWNDSICVGVGRCASRSWSRSRVSTWIRRQGMERSAAPDVVLPAMEECLVRAPVHVDGIDPKVQALECRVPEPDLPEPRPTDAARSRLAMTVRKPQSDARSRPEASRTHSKRPN
ncbi:hypothetical protein GCM10010532_059440 [Dactylosporangium siamense]|uniref:Uncharacterized protein n=1 Tax=Dactylosporangium siamense TaxID=685454 RepID=A0A919PMV4_9ACTN|nr:hypothetical protein Dsi01nite_041570 [Dactylosporangium siamense]